MRLNKMHASTTIWYRCDASAQPKDTEREMNWLWVWDKLLIRAWKINVILIALFISIEELCAPIQWYFGLPKYRQRSPILKSHSAYHIHTHMELGANTHTANCNCFAIYSIHQYFYVHPIVYMASECAQILFNTRFTRSVYENGCMNYPAFSHCI